MMLTAPRMADALPLGAFPRCRAKPFRCSSRLTFNDSNYFSFFNSGQSYRIRCINGVCDS